MYRCDKEYAAQVEMLSYTGTSLPAKICLKVIFLELMIIRIENFHLQSQPSIDIKAQL